MNYSLGTRELKWTNASTRIEHANSDRAARWNLPFTWLLEHETIVLQIGKDETVYETIIDEKVALYRIKYQSSVSLLCLQDPEL